MPSEFMHMRARKVSMARRDKRKIPGRIRIKHQFLELIAPKMDPGVREMYLGQEMICEKKKVVPLRERWGRSEILAG